MTRQRIVKTNFTAGEVSPELYGRGDLRGYENGAARLTNAVVLPTGGARRRAGLRHIDTISGPGRLIAFEFNTEQTYLLVLTDLAMAVYADGGFLVSLAAPWTESQLAQLSWTQDADTLIVCHPDVAMQRIQRFSDTSWQIGGFVFDDSDGPTRRPYHKFLAADFTLTPSATSSAITLTTNANLFVAGHVGTLFRLAGKEVRIDSIVGPGTANATVLETLDGTAPTKDWDEAAFSPARGYPLSATFHQGRLVLGGAKSLPNHVWMSRAGIVNNFDPGTGLDDEAIDFALVSDQVNAIRAVFSGRHLQIFTSGAEWMVSGEPLSPKTVEARRQTRIGSCLDCNIPPRSVDGATLFVPRDRGGVKEFLYTDLEQAYVSSDLAILAQHLFDAPSDQDYDQGRRLFHLVMADGSIACVTVYRAEAVTAWCRFETDGAFRAIAAVGGQIHVLAERAGAYAIERFEQTLNTDAALTGSDASPKSTWSGLEHLAGRSVKVLADGIVQPDRTVDNHGRIQLDAPASTIEIGLAYSLEIEPLPAFVNTALGIAQGTPIRMIKAVFRLKDTAALRVDAGQGPRAEPFRRFGEQVLDQPIPAFTGDKTVRGLGWVRDIAPPLWRISQDIPLPLTLLSVTTELKVNN